MGDARGRSPLPIKEGASGCEAKTKGTYLKP